MAEEEVEEEGGKEKTEEEVKQKFERRKAILSVTDENEDNKIDRTLEEEEKVGSTALREELDRDDFSSCSSIPLFPYFSSRKRTSV